MKAIKILAGSIMAMSILTISGCATIVNDPNIPIAVSFSDGSTGKCTFENKRGRWESEIPTSDVMIRRSDDALVYECETTDGRTASGSIRSEIEGEKIGASVLFLDFGLFASRNSCQSLESSMETSAFNVEVCGSSMKSFLTNRFIVERLKRTPHFSSIQSIKYFRSRCFQ